MATLPQYPDMVLLAHRAYHNCHGNSDKVYGTALIAMFHCPSDPLFAPSRVARASIDTPAFLAVNYYGRRTSFPLNNLMGSARPLSQCGENNEIVLKAENAARLLLEAHAQSRGAALSYGELGDYVSGLREYDRCKQTTTDKHFSRGYDDMVFRHVDTIGESMTALVHRGVSVNNVGASRFRAAVSLRATQVQDAIVVSRPPASQLANPFVVAANAVASFGEAISSTARGVFLRDNSGTPIAGTTTETRRSPSPIVPKAEEEANVELLLSVSAANAAKDLKSNRRFTRRRAIELD